MPSKTEAINAFLSNKTHRDLSSLYSYNMECQVNVAKDEGQLISGEFKGVKWSGYTDDITTWKSFRIPRNAMDEPVYEDSPIKFDLSAHAEGVGMTGWDWFHRCSRWVAFDFDAITGHSDQHTSKLSMDELAGVQQTAYDLPWVTVRKSTSGQGLHLYVHLNAVPTKNHTEHAALARAILAHMSALTGFDFSAKVDICGGNMWVWHRKMEGTSGLQLIKQGDTLETPPTNWESHIDVVTSRKRKIKHSAFEEAPKDVVDLFERLSGQQTHVPLDDDHRKLIKWLESHETTFWWDADRHMLVTHTLDLAKAHDDLSLKGVFKTDSKGSTDHNCFCYPMRQGAWGVRRYGLGAKECPSWEQDGQGWTKCVFNKEPNLFSVCMLHGGVEDPKGGFVMQDGAAAQDVLALLGSSVKVPLKLQGRQATLSEHKDGIRTVIEIEKKTDDGSFPGWMYKGRKWICVSDTTLPRNESQISSSDYDDVVRHVVDSEHTDAGWVLRTENKWINEPLTHVRSALTYMGLSSKDVTAVCGGNIFRPWHLVKIPFQPEYPGDRTWNRKAPQLKFVPTQSEDLSYPTWRSILQHVSQGLNVQLKKHMWARENGIQTGEDYLKCWIAAMFQEPTEPLPYLFLYSEEQNTGKSILHEALSLLFSPGYVRADQALKNPQFNGELEGAILCALEETNLSKTEQAYNRIKDWVTARQLPIHRKNQTPYLVVNTTKWIQTANARNYCPVFPGDTRITMLNVPTLDKVIPKGMLLNKLQKEAPDFLAAILRLELPPTNDRLRIPVVNTEDKFTAAQANRDLLTVFLDERCHYAPGEAISMESFFIAFREWMDPAERIQWATKQRVTKHMPEKHPVGRMKGQSKWFYGNISFEEPTETKEAFIVSNQYLRLLSEEMEVIR